MQTALQGAGFAPQLSQRGSHAKLHHPDGAGAHRPMHRALATGTLAAILRQTRLSADELKELR